MENQTNASSADEIMSHDHEQPYGYPVSDQGATMTKDVAIELHASYPYTQEANTNSEPDDQCETAPEFSQEQFDEDRQPDLSVLGTVHRVTPARQAKNDKRKQHQRQNSKNNSFVQEKKVPRSFSLRDSKAQDYLQKLLKRNQGEDGEDHINTASAAMTQLGKMLQINAHSPFEHPDLGCFKSLGGLWYYVSTGCEDNAFRSLSGYNCHVRGQSVPFREIEGFKYIIAEAAWIKVQQNEELRVFMTDCPLPYKHYTLVGEMRVRQTPSIASWYVPILDEIARVLKLSDEDGQQHLPDFSFLENVDTQVQKDRKSQHWPRHYQNNNPMHP